MLSSSEKKPWEEELEESLIKDDVETLSQRYNVAKIEINSLPLTAPFHQQQLPVKARLQSQWTRCADAVQEHFSSHVIIEGDSYKLPKEIYAMKLQAKNTWVLYKKRECERRKRIRRKIQKEKEREYSNQPSNLLLALVDRCESCKRFYITVNLFWGVTLCDSCYFNENVIHEVMRSQREKIGAEYASSSSILRTAQDLKRKHKENTDIENEQYYKVPMMKRFKGPSENPFEEEDCDIVLDYTPENTMTMCYQPLSSEPQPPPTPVVTEEETKLIEDFLSSVPFPEGEVNNEPPENDEAYEAAMAEYFPIHFSYDSDDENDGS